MPRYINAAGVAVDIPAELAEHLHGYTPADADVDATVSVSGPGAGGGGGGGEYDPDAVGIGGHTLAQWADWLEAEEDHRVLVETWLEAEEAEAKKAAEPANSEHLVTLANGGPDTSDNLVPEHRRRTGRK